MDDLYPSMNIEYRMPLTTAAEIYVYGSTLLGLLAALALLCIKEPHRYYRTMKRKNTDENPVMNI
jgi:hypothetical protein